MTKLAFFFILNVIQRNHCGQKLGWAPALQKPCVFNYACNDLCYRVLTAQGNAKTAVLKCYPSVFVPFRNDFD